MLLARHFGPTPLVAANSLSRAGRQVFLKNETVLPTGSFKVRGALYALSANVARGDVREVVTASTGNHGAAVAFAARLLGVPARIFLPRGANPVKASRIRELGATLEEAGHDLSAAIDAAADYAGRAGAFLLQDAQDPDIPAGPATIGAEILEQLPSVEAVYIPMGDTALIRGVASALRLANRKIHVIGIAAAGAPAYSLSWNAGAVVETESADTMADGLAVSRPLAPNVAAIRRLVDEVVTVTEQEMLDAIVLLSTKERLRAEPSGAAAVAAAFRESDPHGDVGGARHRRQHLTRCRTSRRVGLGSVRWKSPPAGQRNARKGPSGVLCSMVPGCTFPGIWREAPMRTQRNSRVACVCAVLAVLPWLAAAQTPAKTAAQTPPPHQGVQPTSLEEARKMLDGKWALVSLTVHAADGRTSKIAAEGTLTSDFSSMVIEFRMAESGQKALADLGIKSPNPTISTSGRVLINIQKSEITYANDDLRRRAMGFDPSLDALRKNPFALERLRYYTFGPDNTLRLSTRYDDGKEASVSVWKRAS